MTNMLNRTSFEPVGSTAVQPLRKNEQGMFVLTPNRDSKKLTLGGTGIVGIEGYGDLHNDRRAMLRRDVGRNPATLDTVNDIIARDNVRFSGFVALHMALANNEGPQTQGEGEIAALTRLRSHLNKKGRQEVEGRIQDYTTNLGYTACNLTTILDEQIKSREEDSGSGVWLAGQHEGKFGAIPVLGVGVQTIIGENPSQDFRIRLAPVTVDADGNRGFAPVSFQANAAPYFQHPDAK